MQCRRQFLLRYLKDPVWSENNLIAPCRFRCCDNCERTDAPVNLAFETALLLIALQEFNGAYAISAIIDVLRGSATKRSALIPVSMACVARLRGRGEEHSFTWWYEFAHGILVGEELVICQESKPNVLIVTERGSRRASSYLENFNFDKKVSTLDLKQLINAEEDEGCSLVARLSYGMFEGSDQGKRKAAALSTKQQQVLEVATSKLISIADSNDTISFFVLPEIRLRALITAPLVVIEEFLKDSNLNTDFFLSNPDTKAEFGSFLWNELNERASHFCAYQKRSGATCGKTAKHHQDQDDGIQIWYCTPHWNTVNSNKEKTTTKRARAAPLVYCSCNKTWTDRDSFAFLLGCEKGDDCKNGAWFHWKCAGFSSLRLAKKFSDENPVWYCASCRPLVGEGEKEGVDDDPKELDIDLTLNPKKDRGE